MRTRRVAPGATILLLTLAGIFGSALEARAGKLKWANRLKYCEPPSVFYTANHTPGRRPCCPLVEGACAGGVACPPGGICPGDGKACVPGPIASRPNVMMILADDQGSCHYGTAGECRSAQSGTPIPPPVTPNLDLLAGHGTVFPIAHNTASWCYPSLASILTGRYAKNFGGASRIADRLGSIAKVVRSLDGAGAPADPWNPGNVVGGYCTFLGGKFNGSVGDHGFDAIAKGRRLGRTTCLPGENGGPPRCGSEAMATYAPTTIWNMEDLFEFLEGLLLRVPGTGSSIGGTESAEFTMQHFFTWVAPRVPHQPLSSPPEIENYLFGSVAPPAVGGLFNLLQYCSVNVCAPVVTAFNESNFGTQRAFYASMWWVDDMVREIRKHLAQAGTPHCIDAYGMGRYDVTDPAQCQGVWASAVTPEPARNTVIMYLTDNGWFLPNSKHAYSENGYRTRLIVFDPRNLPEVPGWDGAQQTPPPPNETLELAHSTDVLATTLGYALGTPGPLECPMAADGTRCDGRDLRPFVAQSGLTPATEPLRQALCGHRTKRPTAPTKQRYLLTRPGSVGRCVDLDAPACSTDPECGPGATCVGGRCTASAEGACSSDAQCASGARCLGGTCRAAPACIDDAACGELFPGGNVACADKEARWCRNAPGVRCGTHGDCPVCPPGPGGLSTPPCGRVCEPRQLKLYVTTGSGSTGGKPQLTDLFLDPDESKLFSGQEGTLVDDMSRPDGRHLGTMQRLNCCIDEWWPEPAIEGGSLCSGGCPADFSCTE